MTSAGVALEARVQRLFLAQGIFAERSLFPAADVGHRLLATDIDVLVSEYSSGFHLTRRHAECKSGRHVAILDRVLWLNGVRAMLGADASYLVLPSFDEDGADFARSLGVDVMTVKQLETWETALNIPPDRWPNRSDFQLLDPIRKHANEAGRRQDASSRDRVVRQAIQFVEIDSWRLFGYGRLNRLLRLLKDLSDLSSATVPKQTKNLGTRYSASALLVRLSQYLLAVCHDVSRVPVSDLHSYLSDRLIFGDQDPRRARRLVQTTVDWMSQALREQGATIPRGVDSSRLFQAPGFSDGLISLTQKLLGAPNEARYLPIAMETEQFGKDGQTESFPRLGLASRAGRELVALVKGFSVASVGVDKSLLEPLWEDLNAPDNPGQRIDNADKVSCPGQPGLNLEGA